jgi:hypothetical protein
MFFRSILILVTVVVVRFSFLIVQLLSSISLIRFGRISLSFQTFFFWKYLLPLFDPFLCSLWHVKFSSVGYSCILIEFESRQLRKKYL